MSMYSHFPIEHEAKLLKVTKSYSNNVAGYINLRSEAEPHPRLLITISKRYYPVPSLSAAVSPPAFRYNQTYNCILNRPYLEHNRQCAGGTLT